MMINTGILSYFLTSYLSKSLNTKEPLLGWCLCNSASLFDDLQQIRPNSCSYMPVHATLVQVALYSIMKAMQVALGICTIHATKTADKA